MQPASLHQKLTMLRRLLLTPTGKLPSLRDLERNSADSAGRPAISHSAIGKILDGSAPGLDNVPAVARAFDCPAAYLLPGWDDLTALTVFEQHPAARQALRLLDGLDDGAADELLAAARAIRLSRGLDDEDVPEAPPLPPLPTVPADGRLRRRRLPMAQAAERAAEDLQG